MISAIVSDTTALIVLGKLRRLAFLGKLFKQVHVPQAVLDKLRQENDAIEETLLGLSFVSVHPNSSKHKFFYLNRLLGSGEAEAISLAKAMSLPLIIDEKKGRSVARSLGVPVIGLLGLFILAKRRGIFSITDAEKWMREAEQTGYYVSPRLALDFRHALGKDALSD
ncbi:MAG: hypothetical protein ABFS45_09540 [Pseudomonadota bacterium]